MKGPDDVAWRFMDIDGSTLVGAAGNPESALQITAISDGTSGIHTQTATVRVRQGFAGAIYDLMDDILDAETGAIASKKDYIQTTIEGLEDKIEQQEDRLETQEMYLRARFARMEVRLTQLDGMRAAVDAMVSQFEANRQAR